MESIPLCLVTIPKDKKELASIDPFADACDHGLEEPCNKMNNRKETK